MVIDDEISQDELVKSSMRMSKPAGTGMSIIDRKTAIQNFSDGKYDSHKVFIIVKDPSVLLELINAGVDVPEVNLGALFEDGDRKPYTKRVALTNSELDILKQINDKGVPVTLQYTPNDERVSLKDILTKHEGE